MGGCALLKRSGSSTRRAVVCGPEVDWDLEERVGAGKETAGKCDSGAQMSLWLVRYRSCRDETRLCCLCFEEYGMPH